MTQSLSLAFRADRRTLYLHKHKSLTSNTRHHPPTQHTCIHTTPPPPALNPPDSLPQVSLHPDAQSLAFRAYALSVVAEEEAAATKAVDNGLGHYGDELLLEALQMLQLSPATTLIRFDGLYQQVTPLVCSLIYEPPVSHHLYVTPLFLSFYMNPFITSTHMFPRSHVHTSCTPSSCTNTVPLNLLMGVVEVAVEVAVEVVAKVVAKGVEKGWCLTHLRLPRKR